ncbi:MAG: tRNA (N6-isopentenyl adenosine(37)-C2)-methylthiotransferase MiaB [Micavibrio aeruginosavorus]|uniref:tRNA-2-methylthio-N(6)-dimethylallyladenosine synthase n=1 Tax=Micavibrio aeruginosavorus TaxID=349221 RepID=A0A7T5UHD8_9BACT|nr:MAG: tRNA (N6-isopentenyl adenosine(37)-C2)-methylthiotransferase MiaB [Micavibrio aeruginosavorus]
MSGNAQKKLYIKTWGCQMNVYDSRRMADILAPLGYRESDSPEDADMVILNTCHIREKATDKVFSDLGRLNKHKQKKEKRGEKMLIAVAGCVAQAEGDVIMERAQYVDMVFGPQTYHELPEMIIRATGERVVNTDFAVESKFDSLPQEHVPQGVTAFLSIQEGCDKFCTFCVVPYTRGAEYSRPVQQIIDEARRLRDSGAKEITLLGQNVNAYHGMAPNGRTMGLAELIAAVAEVEGVERIRYMTSHPRDMDQDLIDAHGNIPKLMPFLHLPVQHGADEILKQMNRKHTADDYRDIILRLKKIRPDINLSSDFIVGFPGETDRHFEELMQLVRDIGFGTSYSFKYSPRPGTPAANMQNIVPEKIKDDRLQTLQNLLFSQHREINETFVGKAVEVLTDGKGNRPSQLHGRTSHNQAIHVTCDPALLGQIVTAKVTSASATALTGEII